MSEIKALGKLRNLDRCIDMPMLKNRLCANTNTHNVIAALEAIANEIEAEIAERFMELPVDADSVPIHMGDSVESKLLDDSTVSGTVSAFHLYDDELGTVYVRVKPTKDTWTIRELQFKRCRHVKPRTVEDVLRDVVALCAGTWKDETSAFKFYDVDNVMESGNIADYADEIRSLIGGEDA